MYALMPLWMHVENKILPEEAGCDEEKGTKATYEGHLHVG
jgi:hypothetical protein